MPAVRFRFRNSDVRMVSGKIRMYRNSLITSDHLYLLIGQNIRNLRRQRNMTQEQLAELIDGDQKVISKIESGKARPGLSLYLRIANVFQVSIDRLLVDEAEINGHVAESGKILQQSADTAEMKLTQDILSVVLQYLQTKEK